MRGILIVAAETDLIEPTGIKRGYEKLLAMETLVSHSVS